jgi:molybdopterin-guanine dinucleotide biosynthesis protein A
MNEAESNRQGVPSLADATAVVLTGGKSSRMGRPKSLLLFDGEPLIVHIVRALKQMFAETVIVAAPEQVARSSRIGDEVAIKDLGGIYYHEGRLWKFCFRLPERPF